ncbi:hypothetical protein F383_31101 [Gossypium arboreum]
MPKSP